MSKTLYQPTTFRVNNTACHIKKNGVIIFFHGNFRRVYWPKSDDCGGDIERIRGDMLSYGIDGRVVARIIDYGFVHSLRIRGMI